MTVQLLHDVYFSLGSNLGNRLEFLRFGMRKLELNFKLIKTSSVYETQSWGYDDGMFLNSVAWFKTHLSPIAILEKTQEIEKMAGREFFSKIHDFDYHSRTLDIDLLFYDQLVFADAKIQIPHPRLHQRKFVLLPFAEINDSFVHPVYHKTIKELLNDCNDKTQVNSFDSAI